MESTKQADGEQPQAAQKDDSKSPLMDLYSCDHAIAPTLQERLVDREACPACLVNYHIKVIEDLQGVLDKRGGIFLSKTSDPIDESIIPHRDCMRLWTVVKLECYQDISLLEAILQDDPQQGSVWGIEEALQKWYRARPDCARVPGCHIVVQEQMELREEGKSEPGSTVDQVTDVGDDNEHIENVDPERDEATLRDESQPLHSALETTLSFKDQDIRSTNDNVPRVVQDVAQQPDHNTDLKDWAIFDAAADLQTPREAPLTPSSPPTTPISRSALKGSRSSTPASRPRTTFTEQTTIIAPNFRYSGSTDHKPHNKHTSAEAARRQPHFHRPSATYAPATWSSPEGHEKDNTSHYNTSWYRYEMVMEIGKWAKQGPKTTLDTSHVARENPHALRLAQSIREVEDSLLAKNRAKARRREQVAAMQGELSKVTDGKSGDEDGEAVKKKEGVGRQKCSALDAGIGEPESER